MKATVLFDGVCNFCNGSVNFIIGRDSGRYFKFAPLQSAFATEILSNHTVDKENTDSIVLVENGRVYLFSTAALRIASRLDGVWPLLYVFIVIPRPIRDFFYKLFAKYRYKLFGRTDQCMIPTPEVRERFLAEAKEEVLSDE